MPTVASRQDGTYPRPQLIRGKHLALDVLAGFRYDDADVGRDRHWENDTQAFAHQIQLPFPPESPASGIGDTSFHPVVWYRIPVTDDMLAEAGGDDRGSRMLLHFGAVDYEADVWVDGMHVASHVGGQTPFSADITAALDPVTTEHSIVVRAKDDPLDVTMPRGKQDWLPEPHDIWYHRTTGIWRTVWLEAVPRVHITDLAWTPDVPRATVRAEIELSSRPFPAARIDVEVSLDGRVLAHQSVTTTDDQVTVDIALGELRNGQHYERALWSPEHPRLIDATVRLTELNESGEAAPDSTTDEVSSYFGLRTTAVEHGRFLLNDRPIYVRSVLEQGYWPESHLTPPSVEALREEVELILSLGFNAARIHQKVEDPRFLYWADRLGLMIWGETAGAYSFTATAVQRLTTEWIDIVRRDRSHPSIITWVPINESWGVQHGASDPAQRAYGLALVNLTRALDATRPVISNDGWEHTDSDIWSIHDYEPSGSVLSARYGSRESIDAVLDGMGPAGRRMSVQPGGRVDRDQPVMLTEFGGVSYTTGQTVEDNWGYSTAQDADDFRRRLADILDAVNASPILQGFCYTQITDTRQETNGLCDENRKPKLPVETIAGIIRGTIES
ncbi:glycoside hydrolase family 2 protein [Planctomonas psychrotolerans]|uniref:glycoside hydrolase family 2 protein n=1 Tax=Planctomonas psychrotolerans TaxID=2528712 RepID=UPI00123BD015|nr:glycoside hydrolase family 2 TIM barrel-domain containing protein [Planctomonas psychrotolerans]